MQKSMRVKTNTLPATRVSGVLKIKAEKKAESLGMNLSEYIRYLIQKDVEGIINEKDK